MQPILRAAGGRTGSVVVGVRNQQIKQQRAWVQGRRLGATVLEFAIVGPVLFLAILGAIQFAGLSMSQNVLTAAAREGGRVASMPGTVSSDTVVDAVEALLQRGGINPGLVTITVDPMALASLETGDEVKVSVSGAMRDLTWIGAVVLPNANLSAEISYTRE